MSNDTTKKHIISEVWNESIAKEVGIKPGDALISINECEIKDILDYYFLTSDDFIEILIEKDSGENWLIEIDKEFDEPLGLIFDSPTISPIKNCQNNCIFCFVNQLPSGMRKSLYVKDDDYRLSPFHGNYITLTNINETELERLVNYRISPMFISVHTTNPELRQYMLNNPRASQINNYLSKLKNAGIEIHGQIVMCPGVNDGKELEKTIVDLSNYYPEFQSLAVVPVGLTKHREGNTTLRPVTSEQSQEVIQQVEALQNQLLMNLGTRFVFLADEFYLMAGHELPSNQDYENFPQIDNGVGLIRKFEQEVRESLNSLTCQDNMKVKETVTGTVVTGELGEQIMQNIITQIENSWGETSLKIIPINNNFFGPQVTVAGLVTGRDIIDQIKPKLEKGEIQTPLLIPNVMLKDGENVFLDDLSIEALETELDIKTIIVPVNGEKFVKTLRDFYYTGL
ncbi:DUF512 domain-containing protein [Natranaerobius thermophilus]|uniref:Uncharacterized protein n=1 Tax=Natranaerobius thermophilus (strain ATCC BAA-1301 / DSM 18059 / JW/NM-WN-LF) TaxID=457570 RepID=B2A4N0_NATTJ|nr:DUF512 domain-containing protein [Natranaerobius thermophilus]ACB85205.1 protein of unknown function DUF512 [Natranaerobius thermophilus JW/NM-WN-LF]